MDGKHTASSEALASGVILQKCYNLCMTSSMCCIGGCLTTIIVDIEICTRFKKEFDDMHMAILQCGMK